MDVASLRTVNGVRVTARESAPARVQTYLIDDFTRADEPGVTTHGEQVQYELNRRFAESGGLKVERIQLPLEFDTSDILADRPGALAKFFADHFVDRLQADSQAWTTVLHSNRGRAVIDQSQGASESRAVEHLFNSARRDGELRTHLERQLGLPETGSGKFGKVQQQQLLAALVARSEEVHTHDPEIQKKVAQLRELQSQAAQQGHIHVISAGNSGVLYREMVNYGVPIPSKFFVNEMASSASIIVGASDDGSKEASSSNPHTVARLASPFAGAMFGADGVDRPITVDGKSFFDRGSSYASPQVSSLIISLLEEQPWLTRDDIVARLSSRARPVPGGQDYVGAGVL